jgi:hypothetical protein
MKMSFTLNIMMRIRSILRRIVLIVTGTVSLAIIVSLIISAIYRMPLRDALGITLMVEVFLLFLLSLALLTGISERMVIHQAYTNPFIPKEVRENIMKKHGKDRDTGIFVFVLALILLLILFLLTQL